MKFIRPIVTDRPMLMMKSRLPYATPSNSTPTRLPSMPAPISRMHRARKSASLLPGFLARILHIGDAIELDVGELAVALLDLADIDRLHHVARLGVDHDRATRARDLQALQHGHRLVTVEIGAGLVHDLVDR